jgi:CIC family chloride channel protein
VTVLKAESKLGELRDHAAARGQHLYPVTDSDGKLTGVITRKQLRRALDAHEANASVGEVSKEPMVAFGKEPLRVVVSRMAQSGLTVLPVVEEGTRKFAGMISLRDLLHARAHNLREEHHRERVLPAA